MEQQQAPAAAGEVVQRLSSPEQQALERVLVVLGQSLASAGSDRLTGSLAVNLGQAARRMVLAAFRGGPERSSDVVNVTTLADHASRVTPAC